VPCPAALTVIFYPLIEARQIFYAVLGFGPLAKRNRKAPAPKELGSASPGRVSVELGRIEKLSEEVKQSEQDK
jgi:hypothetical protein